MTDRLNLPLPYREELEALLREHVPGVEVWAYGSRVDGRSHDGSNLDLVLRSPTLEPLGYEYVELVKALEQSDIPILVQTHDWARLPESFHREIERDYVVVQDVGLELTSKGYGGWAQVSIGDMVDIKHGFAFKGDYIHDEPRGDVLLTPGNFGVGGGFKGERFKFYDGHVPEEFVLSKGDLLVTMTDLSKLSDTLGYPALVPDRPEGRRYLHNQRLGKVTPKRAEAIDTRFLYYVMCTADYRQEVLASATGTTVKHTSPDRIKQFRFMLPPLPEQRAIAHILGALDDKIELNRRLNETLEAMARAIFQDWFVDFGPVRTKIEGREPYLSLDLWDLFPDRLVDSELGEIPEGWTVGEIGDVATQRRQAVKPKDIGPGTPYIALEHMPRKCVALSEWDHAEGLASGKFRFHKSDILFGKLRPYFHKVGVAPLDGVCSTDIVVVSPKPSDWFGLALGHLSSAEFIDYTDATSTGTRMPRANWKDMALYKIGLPGLEVARSYAEVVWQWTDKIVSNIHESRFLAAQRDALLPKLVSGEIIANQWST
ncbi:MAG: restriction endonuclease subunit S [Chloroflexi bacterium]|nr:restriction endonuclease subunit S [Chloroflexota bacterium]MYD49819.1 restriction endonuclease subunit S [Chloroflexota bacterium]